jgi:hypothetical protein
MDTIKKYWLVKTGLIALLPCALVMCFNYLMDPLWCFDVSNKYNRYQEEFNERKQKTNFITCRDFNYRGILLGSSRMTFTSQYSFRGLPVYNYAVNSMRVDELSCLTEYAKKRNGRDFEYIFLGLDFENARPNAVSSSTPAETSLSIEEAGSLLYRVKALLSIDTAKRSYRVWGNYMKPPWRYYDRNNVQHVKKFTVKEVADIFSMHFKSYAEKKSYYRTLGYGKYYRRHLETFRKENLRSTIVAFIPPLSLPLIQLVVEYGYLDDYFRWMYDIVDVFGTVHLFAYPNEVTTDYLNNFFDPIHAYPAVGDRIIDAIYNDKISGDSKFGMVITRANFPEKRVMLEKLMRNVHDPLFGPILKKAGPVVRQ